MKHLFLSTLGFFISWVVLCATLPAQKLPPLDKSPADISIFRSKKTIKAKVVYSRPMAKGRTVMGKLVPYGKVWRTGANEATEIKFYQDTQVSGDTVKAGTYSLFTIADKETDKWTIILNKELDQWGAYNYDEDKDVLRVEVPSKQMNKPIDAFTITFKEANEGAHLLLAWDHTLVEVPLLFN